MPVFFIHGVPDTNRVWDSVRAELGRDDTFTASLPGFDAPIPDGFCGTKEEHVDFLIAAISQLGAPVDLVGHDWGGTLAVRIASLRPDLVASWAVADSPLSASYEWHELAKIWQTANVGELWMETMDADEAADMLAKQGVPKEQAREATHRMDARMKDAILRLYRSAVTVGAEWEPDLANIRAPGLVLWGERDEPCPVRFSEVLAAATRADVTTFPAGHWLPVELPREFAHALQQHWKKAKGES